MITVPTVLILGAGTSAPFGFPLGIGLRQQILNDLIDANSGFTKQLVSAGHSNNAVLTFREALMYSGKESVDAFLEFRTDFLNVGRAAIAQALMRYESLGVLFQNLDGNLYSYLYKQFSAGIDNFRQNKVAVLTFNYDRSFEQFLFTALKHSYNLSDEEAADLIGSISIIHLHGHMGLLPWQGDGGRAYGGDMSPEQIQIATRSIKIIHEAVDEDPEFQKAYELIEAAKRVIFLGFGYDKTNLRRLRINFSNTDKQFFGSCFRFSDLERNQLHIDCARNIDLGLPHQNALDFLRNHVLLTVG